MRFRAGCPWRTRERAHGKKTPSAADFDADAHAIIENTIDSREVGDTPAGTLAATAVSWFWSREFAHPNTEVTLCDTPIAGTIDCVAQALDGG